MNQDRWALSDAVRRIVEFRDARDWKQFHRPKELAAALAIEAAELQELFLWKDPEPSNEVAADAERMNRIEQEVADVTIYLLLLAHELGIDLRAAVDRKMVDNARRYEVERSRGRADKAH
jgi:NTP pyrophosphatase (non-canonical NTP hydrolase)